MNKGLLLFSLLLASASLHADYLCWVYGNGKKALTYGSGQWHAVADVSTPKGCHDLWQKQGGASGVGAYIVTETFVDPESVGTIVADTGKIKSKPTGYGNCGGDPVRCAKPAE